MYLSPVIYPVSIVPVRMAMAARHQSDGRHHRRVSCRAPRAPVESDRAGNLHVVFLRHARLWTLLFPPHREALRRCRLTRGPAIVVEGLGKLYQLSHRIERHATLRDALTAAAMAPWRRFRSLSGTDASMEDFWALKDVSFEVHQGEVVGIIGRNGAGKSTLLKILSRIVEPTEGSARLRGRVASLLEVGTGFHPELSGRENIYLNGSILGMKKREIAAKFDEIVAFAEIEKFLDTPVKKLFVRNVCPPRVRRRRAPRPRDPDRRRSAGGRRCRVPEEMPRQDEADLRGRRSHRALREPQHGRRAGPLLQGDSSQERANPASRHRRRRGRCLHAAGTNRSRRDRFRFKPPPGARIWMYDAAVLVDGEPAATVPMGSKISLLIRFATETPTRHPRIGWVLQSASGERLLSSNNRYQDSPAFDEPAAAGEIVCDLGVRTPHARSLRRFALARRHRHRPSRRIGDSVLSR